MKTISFLISGLIILVAIFNYVDQEVFDLARESADVRVEIKIGKEKVLMEELLLLKKDVSALEKIFGPSTGWVDGNRHCPAFIESAIKSEDSKAFDCLKYLWTKIYIAKVVISHSDVISSSTTEGRRLILIKKQFPLLGSARVEASRHFRSIEDVLRSISLARRYGEVSAILKRYSPPVSLSIGASNSISLTQ